MRFATLLLASTLALSACGGPEDPTTARELSEAEVRAQDTERLNAWFADRWQERLARKPMLRTSLGLDGPHGRLDDISRLGMDEDAALEEAWLEELERDFDVTRLSPEAALSHRLWAFAARDALDGHLWADKTYAFTHMSGPHTGLPSFLINTHKVETADDARAYISRLRAADAYLAGARERAEAQASEGVFLPAFVYPKLSEAARNVIAGAPFRPQSEGASDSSPDSPLWADFKTKVALLDIPATEQDALLDEARAALLEDVLPAYDDLLSLWERHAIVASDDDGVWKIDETGDYYAARLRHYTTTDLSADEIHEIGLREVAAIQSEMESIVDEVGFDGTLEEFFVHLRTDPQFTYPDDAEGRERYIDEATAYIDAMRARLDELFITKPRAGVVVKRVEPFREDSAFFAFYERPAQDGSRPGTYYINLRDMNELPTYQMQALAYHEGIPGHHMQIAIAQELGAEPPGDVPDFRRIAIHVPYVEGWALYAEEVPKELGLYTDPYQRFGQLSMALFRAARLVVDTGIHSRKWTRAEAVSYMLDNTANSEGDIAAEVDRYIVWPGQATAYMIGKLKIVELRKRAQERLGDRFSIREFHDAVLSSGSVPLPVLEDQIEAYITSKETDA